MAMLLAAETKQKPRHWLVEKPAGKVRRINRSG
jgi:hypothetical protein